MPPTATPIADFIYHWQSLIAVLIAGTFTLTAAGIAWCAVQRQISNQRAIARRSEDDALTAIKEGSRELLGMMNLVWRAVDVFIANRVPENRQPNFSLIWSLRDAMPREDNLAALAEIAEQLGPTNKRRFLLFLNMVRSLYRHYGSYKEERRAGLTTESEWRDHQNLFVYTLRTYLTHSCQYLEAFDRDLTMQFEPRQKTKVDHRDLHEHLEPSVARAEEGKNWLGG